MDVWYILMKIKIESEEPFDNIIHEALIDFQKKRGC
jgi:hypothetical protein